MQRRLPRLRITTGQLVLWLERKTPDQEDRSSNPLCGEGFGALTEGGKTLGSGLSFHTGTAVQCLLATKG